MLWRICVGCCSQRGLSTIPPSSLLCVSCVDELNELRCEARVIQLGGPPLVDITGLYHYQGLVRRLILRAKIGGDLQALQLLLALVATHPARGGLLAWADGLMPCASSLWGRVRGRIDIAGQICSQQGDSSRPISLAPLHLHWRWRKHALLQRRQRVHSNQELPHWLRSVSNALCAKALANANTTKLLLIDDVVTSGDTMRRTAMAITAAPLPVIRGLVLAVS